MKLLMTRNFNYVPVDFYAQDSSDFWVTREQIGMMLGYRHPEYLIRNIHDIIDYRLANSFREIQINTRKGLCVTTVYNFNGLLEICKFSHKRQAKNALNFLWEVKSERGIDLPATTGDLRLFNYGENQVRAIKQNGEFWFVAKDVCDILGLTNVTEAIKSLADDEKMTLRNSEGQKNRGGAQFYNVINEPGIYRLIFRSNKPEAENFKHWVFHEVLPSLRMTGTYTIGIKPPKKLTGKAADTQFYSAEDIGLELGMNDMQVVNLASDHGLMTYGFTRDCDWYFTEEGRAKILHAARI